MEEHKDPDQDVSIANLTDTWSCLGVAGPRSASLLSSLFGDDHFANRKWPLLSHDVLSMNGVNIRVMRISYTGEHIHAWKYTRPLFGSSTYLPIFVQRVCPSAYQTISFVLLLHQNLYQLNKCSSSCHTRVPNRIMCFVYLCVCACVCVCQNKSTIRGILALFRI